EFVFMARRGYVIALELRHQDVCLRTKASRSPAYLFVVIRVLLQVNHCEIIAGNVDAFACRVKSHVVGHLGGWQGRDDLAGFGIQDDEARRFSTPPEKALL